MKGRLTTVVTNRKARYEYYIKETYEAGLVLKGTEVKSLRNGKASLQEAYCYIEGGEVFVKGMNINEYDKGSYNNHDPKRVRKLLLKKQEIRKLIKKTEEKGMTLIPLKIFFSERNLAKLEVGIAQGKKSYDKRESLKEKQSKRDLQREFKNL